MRSGTTGEECGSYLTMRNNEEEGWQVGRGGWQDFQGTPHPRENKHFIIKKNGQIVLKDTVLGGGPQEGSVGHISPCETTKKKAGELAEVDGRTFRVRLTLVKIDI